MLGGREATSEQSLLVCEGTGYGEVYLLVRQPEEDVTWSLERDSFTHSPTEEEEECEEDEDGEEEDIVDEEEKEEGEEDNVDRVEEEEEEGEEEEGDGERVSQVDDDGPSPSLFL